MFLSVVINTMSVLSMLIVALPGYILLSANLMCSMFSFSFKPMLNDFSSKKLFMFSLIGVASIAISKPSFRSLGSLTVYHVLIHISRMALLNVSIVTLLKLALLYLLMHLFLFGSGVMPSPLLVFWSIVLPLEFLIWRHPLNCFCMKFLTILFLRCLGVLVGLTYAPTINGSWNFALKNVFFLGIVLFTRATNVFMFLPIVSISLGMSSLIKNCFLLPTYRPPRSSHLHLLPLLFLLTNL